MYPISKTILVDLNTLCLITYSIVLCYDVYLDVCMYVSVVYFLFSFFLRKNPALELEPETSLWLSLGFHQNLNTVFKNQQILSRQKLLKNCTRFGHLFPARKFKWDLFELFVNTVFSFTAYRNWVRTENCSVQDNFFPWQVTFRSDPYL